jgi:hypothetical protein
VAPDFHSTRERLLAHYIHLGALPGWKEYVWHQVKTMAKETPELFGDFPELLTRALAPPRPSSSPTAPGSPTPRA